VETIFEEALEELELLKAELGYNNAPKRVKPIEAIGAEPIKPPDSSIIQRDANSMKSNKDPTAIAKNIKDKKARRKALKEIRRGNKSSKEDFK